MARLLIVEDDLATQFLMSEFVAQLGHDGDVIGDGRACFDLLMARPGHYDLVLMDIHMPGLTGLDAAMMIRNAGGDQARTIPIVAVTADVSYSKADDVASHGIDGVLQKPLGLSDLHDAIQRYLA